MIENFKTLKLDSSYRPVSVINSFEAFVSVWSNRSNLVEVYPDHKIRTAYTQFELPCVISLKRYVRTDGLFLKCKKENVFWRDRNTCQYCSKVLPASSLTLDHVTPRSKGGPKTWENIVACCKACNQKKGDYLPYEINMKPIKPPSKPPPHLFRIMGQKDIPQQWLKYLKGYVL